jgi:hypothetical protein
MALLTEGELKKLPVGEGLWATAIFSSRGYVITSRVMVCVGDRNGGVILTEC